MRRTLSPSTSLALSLLSFLLGDVAGVVQTRVYVFMATDQSRIADLDLETNITWLSTKVEPGLRILAGESAQNIPPQTVPSVTMFDWRQLRRWGIDENKLAPGSIAAFKEPTVWQQYKWRIVGVISLCIIEALLIVWLLINRTRRRQAEEENERLARVAEAARRNLDEVVSNVPGIVWETWSQPGTDKRQAIFVSDYIETMLGYSVEEWLSTPGFAMSIVLEADRDRVARETQALFENARDGVFQFRWVTKDGRILWVESHVAPICDGSGKTIGLRGVTLDITDRKLAEEALRQTEERNHAILRAIPDLMFLQSREGTYLDYHAPDPQQLYTPPSSFLGKNMRQVLPPNLAEGLIRCFERVDRKGDPQVLEYSLPLQGEERWYEARIVLSDGDKVLSIVRDVTDRHRAGEDLRESEERFAKAFKANPQPMSLTRLADGCYLDVNESFLTMSGYTREEVIGHTSLELGIWETPGTRSEFMQRLKERGAIHNLETKFRTKSGSFRLMLSSAEQLELAGEQCVLVASSDITERYQAVEELRQSEERFRNMADTAPVLIWISGPDLLRTYFNQGWLEFTGRKMEQELGTGWTEGVYSEDYARCLEIYNTAFDRREPFKMEYRLRHAEGVFRWIYDCGTPRFSADGEFLGYIGSCIDIADRKAAEETLRDLSGRLINSQEQERSRVARELHDDLSQRIAVLSIGLEQVAQRISEGPDNLHARIQTLCTETQEIGTELHRVSYQLHPLKLDHLGLVAAVRSFCEELAAHHELSIRFRHQGLLASLSSDITLCLFRIVQESLRNAVKHSGAREVQVVLEKTDDAVRLSVSDTGCGFDTGSSKMTSGLGFLSMRERLRLVGGQLSIRSRPFEGTQIEIAVPLVKREEVPRLHRTAKVADLRHPDSSHVQCRNKV